MNACFVEPAVIAPMRYSPSSLLNPGPKLTLGVGVSMSTFTHASAIAAVLETMYSAYCESIAKAGAGSTKN